MATEYTERKAMMNAFADLRYAAAVEQDFDLLTEATRALTLLFDGETTDTVKNCLARRESRLFHIVVDNGRDDMRPLYNAADRVLRAAHGLPPRA